VIRYLTKEQILFIHAKGIEEHGGSMGLLNEGVVDSAVHAPQGSFSGVEFYPTPSEKAAVLGFTLVMGHAFVDGNKRVGFAAMKTFLLLNGRKLTCTPDDGEATILRLCNREIGKHEFAQWVDDHCDQRQLPGE